MNPQERIKRSVEEHVQILHGLEMGKGLDYETTGKLVVASLHARFEREKDSMVPDADGHVRTEVTLVHSAKFHINPDMRPERCCDCVWDEPFIICRGWCC